MATYAIDTPRRQATFLAQIGAETIGLRYLSEIWGPTPAQTRYEGRRDLGNTQPGDGFRFRGHGLIHVTGRFNHAKVRDRLRVRFGIGGADMEEMRCARCSKKLAVAKFTKLEIKCSRCGNLNRWMADTTPTDSPDLTPERPERLSIQESATHENRPHHSLARRQAPPG